jgi:hypothetical protein
MGVKVNRLSPNYLKHSNDSLNLTHQNIRGLGSKCNELPCSIASNNINPQLICLFEQYLSDQNSSHVKLQNYDLATSYVRSIHKGGGVCTYTECPRRNLPDFGRVFLMLKYTDITQNTYVQSGTVMEIIF